MFKPEPTNPDNAAERIALGARIAELAGDDYVTTTEAAAVVEWCREWASDCEWGDVDAEDIAAMNDAAILRACHRRIDGGLAFVLADVRRTASARRTFEDANPEARERREERARLYGARASDALVNEPAKLAALTTNERAAVEYLRGSVGHDPDAYGAAVLADDAVQEYREAHGADAKARVLDSMHEDYAGLPYVVVTVDAERIDMNTIPADDDKPAELPAERGAFGADIDAACARAAVDAADAFVWDIDGEDDTSAAQRALDILRDLSAEDRPAFLMKLYGVPTEERHAEAEITRRWSHGVPTANDAESIDAWRMLRERAREDRGLYDVARVLTFEHRDIVAPMVFAGHFEEDTSYGVPSTNLSAYREAWHAFECVQALRAHTFGGNALEGCIRHIDTLEARATDAIMEAMRWAIWNNANEGGNTGACETGMPRAE